MRKRYIRRYKGKTLPYDAALRSGQRLWGLPIWGSIVVRLDLPLVTALGITGRERKTTCTELD
jgi:hypothetical protein